MGRFAPEIEALAQEQARKLPEFRVGDTVRVHYRIREGEKERVQVFQGVVIRNSRGGVGATFAVRKRSGGIGVERIFPHNSPRIEQLEVVSSGRVRRAKLYYLRERQGKAARLQELRDAGRRTV
jgi:large subunit ribosomal protein L19